VARPMMCRSNSRYNELASLCDQLCDLARIAICGFRDAKAVSVEMADLPPDAREAVAECSALVEFDGGINRMVANRIALTKRKLLDASLDDRKH